jgi:hypothetical protein
MAFLYALEVHKDGIKCQIGRRLFFLFVRTLNCAIREYDVELTEFLGEDLVLGVRLPSDSLIWTVKELFPLSFTRGDGVSGGGGGVNISLCGRE